MCGAIAFISVSIEFGVNTELIRCFPFPQGSFDLANVELSAELQHLIA